MRLRYDIVDVFTDRPFAGNQLAVVHGAEDLSTAQCLAIAREFNFSETTFPAAPVNGNEYATRIFTPAAEIPFAGHPTLGTAWVLRERGLLTATEATQVCGAGRIGLCLGDDLVELAATPRDLLGPLPEEAAVSLLRGIGLDGADLDGPVWVAGSGLTFVHLPVRADAVARAVPTSRPIAQHVAGVPGLADLRDPLEGIYVHHLAEGAGELAVRARMLDPTLAALEDPATGSAAAGLGMALVASGRLPDGGVYTIAQGVEMGRPSRLRGHVRAEGGRAVECRVGGAVQPVASGEIRVPSPHSGLGTTSTGRSENSSTCRVTVPTNG